MGVECAEVRWCVRSTAAHLALKLLTHRLKHFCASELNITCISFTCSSFIASNRASRSSGVADDRKRSIAHAAHREEGREEGGRGGRREGGKEGMGERRGEWVTRRAR